MQFGIQLRCIGICREPTLFYDRPALKMYLYLYITTLVCQTSGSDPILFTAMKENVNVLSVCIWQQILSDVAKWGGDAVWHPTEMHWDMQRADSQLCFKTRSNRQKQKRKTTQGS